MKMFYSSLLAVMVLGFSSCSQKEEIKITEVTPAFPRAEMVATQEREINNLQNRLDEVRDRTHATKFRDPQSRTRTNVNEAYVSLGQARVQFKEMTDSIDLARFDAKHSELKATLSSVRQRLDHQLAE